MRIFKAEIGKVLYIPMFWIPVICCIVFNIGVVAVYRYAVMDYGYFSYIGKTASVTGNVLGDKFFEKLSKAEDCDEKWRLIHAVKEPENIYESYDAGERADYYIKTYRISGVAEKLFRAKYERLKPSVEKLGRTGAAFSLYAADMTVNMHNLLFGVLVRAIIAECCIIATLFMLHLFSYEHGSRTEASVYTTRTGRGIYKYKLLAGFILSVICFMVIAAVSLVGYFSIFDYSQIWDSSVSSIYNELFLEGSLITWTDFTVGGYLFAVLGMGMGLTLVFAAMGGVIGFFISDNYMGVLIFIMILLSMAVADSMFFESGRWGAYFLFQFSPVMLWFSEPQWFTDMGILSVFPFHETAGFFINVIFWGLLLMLGYKYIKRKEIL